MIFNITFLYVVIYLLIDIITFSWFFFIKNDWAILVFNFYDETFLVHKQFKRSK